MENRLEPGWDDLNMNGVNYDMGDTYPVSIDFPTQPACGLVDSDCCCAGESVGCSGFTYPGGDALVVKVEEVSP